MLDFTESVPNSVMLAISHAVYVKGDQTNFEIEPSFGVEASSLYPDVKYTTVDELLDQFVWGKKTIQNFCNANLFVHFEFKIN